MMLPIRIHTDIQVYICSTALTLLSGCQQLCHIRLISSFHCSTTLTFPIRIHTDIQVYIVSWLGFPFPAIGCSSCFRPTRMAALRLLPLHRCLADSLAPSFSDTVYPCLIWTSAEDLADLLPPYKSLHCMGSLHCVTLYIVVNLPENLARRTLHSISYDTSFQVLSASCSFSLLCCS